MKNPVTMPVTGFSCILKTVRWASGSKKAAADEKNSPCYNGNAVWQLQTTKQGEAMRERSGRNSLASCVIEVKIAVEIIRQKKKHKC